VCIALVLGLAALAPALAKQTDDAAAQRDAIRKERAAIEARFKAGEAECKQRFAVSGCVADLQARRRQDLETLRQRELALDDAKRKAETEANTRRLDAKQAEARSRPPPEPRAEAPPRAASSPGAAAGTPIHNARVPKPSKTADDRATAVARVEAQQRRASEAEARREAAEQRSAERAARGKKSTPLPVPAPLPPASAASR
jgi:hypothetical protein